MSSHTPLTTASGAAVAYRDCCENSAEPDPADIALLQSKLADCANGVDEDRPDIVQFALAELWERGGRNKDDEIIEFPLAYLKTVVKNEAAKICKRRSRESMLVDAPLVPECSPFEECDDKIRRLLQVLPERARQFVELKIKGLDNKQIAKRLKLTTRQVSRIYNTVKSIGNRRISND